MTDEEIIELAEKTKKEKYCKRHQRIEDGFPWCGDCPITYEGYECTDLYSIPFLDGFKAAMEYVEKIIEKSKTPDDGFAYSAIHNDALNDIIKEIKTDKT